MIVGMLLVEILFSRLTLVSNEIIAAALMISLMLAGMMAGMIVLMWSGAKLLRISSQPPLMQLRQGIE